MACLKLPKKLCNEMNSAMVKFWWGQKDDERKIHWKSWLKMSVRKMDGGMGFKDLETFNDALLAKQCWRMLKEPEAFWVKVLKGIHFPNGTIMDARRGAKASWIWSTNLVERDFLIFGMMGGFQVLTPLSATGSGGTITSTGEVFFLWL